MPPTVFTRLQGRIPIYSHDHVAVLYREPSEAVRAASFLADGLKRGDFCHYLAPASHHFEMLQKIRALKVDPDPYLRAQTFRLSAGHSGFRALRDQTRKAFADAERMRAPAVRWLEEGSWPEAAGFPMPEFFEFHAILNYQVKHYPSVAVCQYSLHRLETHHLLSAIATHRHLLVDGTLVRDNPFYIPAEKFIPLSYQERQRDLARVFREVGFDVEKLLEALAGYGRLSPKIMQDG
jgi:hypothetical protein